MATQVKSEFLSTTDSLYMSSNCSFVYKVASQQIEQISQSATKAKRETDVEK